MKKRKLRKARLAALIIGVLGIFLLALCCIYQYKIGPVDHDSQAAIEVVIPSGMSTANIATLLHEKGLIQDPFFFKVYLKLNRVESIKASTYLLKKNMNLETIVKALEKGTTYNKEAVRITFKEGKRLKDYAVLLAQHTNITQEEFLNKVTDKAYLTTLIQNYWFLTDTILQEDIYYGLEGYLAPDTYEFKNKEITVEEVLTTLLQQEEKNLAPLKEELQKTNIHQVITLASMAELEGVTAKDRRLIVGVFQNRLARGMNLGSDVTTYYAFDQEMVGDLTTTMFNTYNPYNTRSPQMAGKLPIGPICNPSFESIEAALHPITSDNLYFVADKHGKVYYTKNQQQHNQKVKELKENGDWIW